MVRGPHADSPPIVPAEVTTRRRVARKRRTKDADSIQGGVELRASRKRRAVKSDSIQDSCRVERGRRGFWVALKGKKRGSIVVEGRDFVQDSEEGGADEYLFVAEEESSADSHQASGGRRGRCGRCGGGLFSSNGDCFLTEEQHPGSNFFDTDNFGGGGLFSDSDEQTGDRGQNRGVLLDAEDVYFALESEQQVGGYVSEMDQHPDDGLFVDSEELAEGIVIVWLSVPRTGGRGHCDRVVVGAEDIYFVPETEQQADGVFVPDSELHPNGCFVPNSDESEQANGGVVDSELHPDSGFVPDSEEQGSGGVLDSELLADGGFVADSKKQAVGGVPNLEEQHLDGIEELVDGEVALVQDDAHAAADDARLTNLLKLAKDEIEWVGMMIMVFTLPSIVVHNILLELLHSILLEIMFLSTLFLFL
uniref:Uncharacterized protein n=1 Tax=Oryza barthii TaxID=65489 RepID=A0A0D3HTW5_9ORYZ